MDAVEILLIIAVIQFCLTILAISVDIGVVFVGVWLPARRELKDIGGFKAIWKDLGEMLRERARLRSYK